MRGSVFGLAMLTPILQLTRHGYYFRHGYRRCAAFDSAIAYRCVARYRFASPVITAAICLLDAFDGERRDFASALPRSFSPRQPSSHATCWRRADAHYYADGFWLDYAPLFAAEALLYAL